VLDTADRVVLRTAKHPGIEDLVTDPRVVSCDDLYEAGATFEDIYLAVAKRVCDAAEDTKGMVAYAVPGSPQFGERSVCLLRDEADRRDLTLGVRAAVSAFDVIGVSLKADLMADEVQIVDAAALLTILDQEPYAGGQVALDPRRPMLVCQVYSQHVASAVKLTLGRLVPDDHPIVIIRAAGVTELESVEHCQLFELDRRSVDHLTSVYVPGMTPLAATRSLYTLQRIVAQLRAPAGCPWDRKQTHQSLRDAIIEEAYETVDAIDGGDWPHLAEELGDLLLIVAMHAQIAEEAGDFALEDVYDAVTRKLVRRHPHVFGDVVAETPEAVVATWDAVKAAERADGDGPATPASPLAKLPRSMPALQKARVVFGARKGAAPVAVEPGARREAGDRLLATARQAAAAGIDLEQALSDALRRYFESDEAVDADTNSD
jgi:tetrapyrrole methylase family protein/MazG family protein